jgi:hypothetical protein
MGERGNSCRLLKAIQFVNWSLAEKEIRKTQ